MNNLTFGRYSPYDTPIHRLDPRNKILLLILLVVAIFLRFSIYSTTLIVSGVLFILLIILMLVSKVRITSLLKALLSMWFLILLLLIIYILVPMNIPEEEKHIAFTLWGFKVYWNSFYQCGYIVLRLLMMLGLTMVLTSTTKPMDLTYGLEWYMSPLKIVRFPAHIIAMIISIALRFIPTLLDETNRIMKAQASRGVDFTHGAFHKRFKAVISLIIPLLVSAFQRSDELADAMEIRGYDPNGKRSRYHKLSFSWMDLIAFILGGAIFAAVLTFVIIDHNAPAEEKIDIIYLLFNIKIGW